MCIRDRSYADAKQRFERNYLVQLLKLTDGSVADAARIADRNRTEFYRLLQKHELTPAVSYKHLDVYKRQTPNLSGNGDKCADQFAKRLHAQQLALSQNSDNASNSMIKSDKYFCE